MTLPDLPVVSVVVPMYNESGYIEACLAGFADQSYPSDRLEVVVVDGGSTDGSRAVVDALARDHSWIRVVDNPKRKASAAFNCGVRAASGEVVCLFSAHGVPEETYVAASVAALRRTDAVGVGGRYDHQGLDPHSHAIGLAMVSPVGMASPHRFATTEHEVDTISHPAYVRQALLDVGPFDESLERNSDYELNWRLRADGGRLVFDPTIGSVYRPRSSLPALTRQFWFYGRWKARVIRRHPGSLRPRHLVAPVAVLGAGSLPLLATAPAGRRAALGLVATYGLVVAGALVRARPRRHGASPVTMAAAFPLMHTSWGAGFLLSLVQDRRRR